MFGCRPRMFLALEWPNLWARKKRKLWVVTIQRGGHNLNFYRGRVKG